MDRRLGGAGGQKEGTWGPVPAEFLLALSDSVLFSLPLLSTLTRKMSEARASREKKAMDRFAPPAAKEDGDKHAVYEVTHALIQILSQPKTLFDCEIERESF